MDEPEASKEVLSQDERQEDNGTVNVNNEVEFSIEDVPTDVTNNLEDILENEPLTQNDVVPDVSNINENPEALDIQNNVNDN